ncbi:MlaD family protein [Puniceibacterium sp. IMCC21224]|uniref:MlaD family protein n=1 Tax=Puniceibacterium sp. IMCC21224 TaxID=1618204 RepID=UPI00065DB066|nr:MlaD family protein [Puniceibacterium sp. IMCC21224]KMK66790.1 qaraquat-inducible protein B [Puniceibacterium sp. IMCC21224]
MSETPDNLQSPVPGDVPIKPARKSLWDMASIVWIIPVAALAVALGAAWRTYDAQGPVIEIRFQNAAGIKADETQLRYRDIAVGTVEEVGFGPDLDEVIVSVRVRKDLADYIDESARFWVVRPEVSARGVSGLDTVLSGVYVQGAWDEIAGGLHGEFEGLTEAPLLPVDKDGVSFTLKSSDGLPSAGTQILYKGVEVGVVGYSTVNQDGSGVTAPAVIYEPHAAFVTSSTRFWDISGFSFSLGASGAQLNFTSLASLIGGGVTFDTIGSGGVPLEDGATYDLFANEDAARDDFLSQGDAGTSVDMTMVFEENLAGLAAGAAVELGGLRIGQVTSINGLVDRDRFGDNEVRLIASVQLNPARIGLGEDADEATLLTYLDTRIAEGLRARLINASIFTGGLKVELAMVPGAPEATLDRDAEPLTRFPTSAARVTDVGATAQGALQRVSDLPIEEVMQSITGFLDNASTLIGSEELQKAPAELTGLLAAVRGVAESPAIQTIPDQVGTLLADLQTTSATLNRVMADLEAQDAPGKLTDVIENVGTATEALPDLMADIRGVLANVQAVPLEALSQSVSDLLATADALLASDDIQGLPVELRGILSSVRDITENPAVQGLPDQATALVAGLQDSSATINRMLTDLETQNATGKLTDTIDSVNAATDALPDLLADLRAVLAKAEAVPLADLTQTVSDVLAQVQTLIASAEVQAVPGELRGLLASVRQITEGADMQALPARATEVVTSLLDTTTSVNRMLDDLETQNVVGKLTAAIDDVAAAAEDLPQLVEEARSIVSNANDIPLDALAERATNLLEAANALIDQDSTRALPGELNAALDAVQQTLNELQNGGLIDNANATLASARSAADAIAEASSSLPRLATELRNVANQAGVTLSAYADNSTFSRETRGAIRQIQSAASAIEKLARTIERNPNSLLLGR